MEVGVAEINSVTSTFFNEHIPLNIYLVGGREYV